MARKKGKNKGYSYRYNKNGTVTCRAYFDMPDGNRKQLPATGETEDEARKKLLEKYGEICKQGKQIKSKGHTVQSWCEYWLFEIKKPTLKGKTFDGYYKKIKNNVYPLLGGKRLDKLKLADIQIFINKTKNRQNKSDPTKKIKGKTAKEIIDPFLQALEYAMENDFMPYINFDKLDKPKARKGTRDIRDKEEQQIITDYFLNRIPGKPFDLYYAPIAVMDARGLRPEECAGLKWEDIDFENDKFWVGRHSVLKNDIYDEKHNRIGAKLVVEDSTKTPQGERLLDMGSFLSNIFLAKHKEYANKGITPKPTDFIFINKVGKLYYEESLRKMYKSLAKKLGISEKGCYTLRHELLTYLAQETNADKETIKQIAGWKEIVSTYFHTDDTHKKEACQQIDKQYQENIMECEEEMGRVNYDNIIQFPLKKWITNKKAIT